MRETRRDTGIYVERWLRADTPGEMVQLFRAITQSPGPAQQLANLEADLRAWLASRPELVFVDDPGGDRVRELFDDGAIRVCWWPPNSMPRMAGPSLRGLPPEIDDAMEAARHLYLARQCGERGDTAGAILHGALLGQARERFFVRAHEPFAATGRKIRVATRKGGRAKSKGDAAFIQREHAGLKRRHPDWTEARLRQELVYLLDERRRARGERSSEHALQTAVRRGLKKTS